MKRRNKYLILFLLLSLNLSYAQGQMKIYNKFMPIDLNRDSNFIKYYNSFKRCVKTDDSLEIAKLIGNDFSSLNVVLQKEGTKTHEVVRVKLKTRGDFLRLYPKIFDARMKKVIGSQAIKDLVLMPEGIMLSHGEIWWKYYEDTKIIKLVSIANSQ